MPEDRGYADFLVPVSAREVIFQSPQAIRYNTHENGPQTTLDNADRMMLEAAAKKGRGGDTELVHVNKGEEELLKAFGGAGTRNPKTGLKEYRPAGEKADIDRDKAKSGGGTGGRGGPRDTGGVTGATKNAAEAREAGRALSDARHDNRSFGQRVSDFFTDKLDAFMEAPGENIGSAAGSIVAGPVGNFVGGLVGQGLDALGGLIGPPDGPGMGSTAGGGFAHGQGAGQSGGTPKPTKPKQDAAAPNDGTGSGPAPTTPTPNPTMPFDPATMNLLEILLGRMETPIFSQTLTPGSINNAKHEAMKSNAMNSIINGDPLNGVA